MPSAVPSSRKTVGKNVNDRLTRNSSTKEIFDAAKQPFQEALNNSGHKFKLEFDNEVKNQQRQQQQLELQQQLPQSQQQQQTQDNNKKKKGRNITWLNAPYSKNVKTPIGKIFFQAINSCFPANHKLRKICNRNKTRRPEYNNIGDPLE